MGLFDKISPKITKEEMGIVFGEVEVVDVDTRAAWYICHCKKEKNLNE